MVVDPKQWPALASNEQPGDMSNIVRYIHGLGLKAGIYTDVGKVYGRGKGRLQYVEAGRGRSLA